MTIKTDLSGILKDVQALQKLRLSTGLLDHHGVLDVLEKLARDAHPAVLTVPAEDMERMVVQIHARLDNLVTRIEKLEQKLC